MRLLIGFDLLVMILFNGAIKKSKMKIQEILNKYINCVFLDEDGNSLKMDFNDSISTSQLLDFEKTNDLKLPEDLRELLLISNGGNFFGLHILSIDEMMVYSNSGLINFHNWGNGDFDCISLGNIYKAGTVIFLSHSEYLNFRVSENLGDWLNSVINEIRVNGTLLHPMDFNQRDVEDCLYEKISNKLK